MLSLSGMNATCVFADEAGESCSGRAIFENPWPTTPDSARAKYDLHQTCSTIIRSDALTATGMFELGMDKDVIAGAIGIGDDLVTASQGSMAYEFGHEILDMAEAGKSQDEIERALFCKCLALPVKAAADNGLSAYH